MHRILCVLKDVSFKEKLEAAYLDIKVKSNVFYCETMDLTMADEYDKIIIDLAQVEDMDMIHKLIIKKGTNNIVVLISRLNDEAAKHLLFTGIHIHYADSPVYSLIHKLEGVVSLENAKANLLDNLNKDGQRLIAITSPAGGVGKTTLALNLADVLSKKGKRVLLADMSVYSDISAKLQIPHKNGLSNLVSSILRDSEEDMEEEKVDYIRNNVYRYEKKNYSFDILYGITPIKAEKITSSVVEEMIGLIKKSDYEIVLFDTCSYDSEASLSLVECMDTVLVLSLPHVGCGWKLIQQKELYECIQVTGKCRLIVNRFSRLYGFSCKQLERELQYPLIGVIPEDMQLGYSSNCGELISHNNLKGSLPYINYIAHQLEPVFDSSEIKIRKINK